MKFEKSVGVIVFRKGKAGPEFLLLQNSSKGFWDFPKGLAEPDESEGSTAKRELKEEAGLEKVRFIDGFREKVTYFYRFEGELVRKDLTMFLGEAADEKVRLSWEHSSHEWLTFDQARVRLKTQKLQLLEKANKFLSSRLRNWMK